MDAEILSDKECIICLDNKEIEWITLECRHEYHKKCIHDWIQVRMICPVCIRAIQLPHNEDTHIVIQHPELDNARGAFYEHRQRETAYIVYSIFIIAIICIVIGSIVYVYG